MYSNNDYFNLINNIKLYRKMNKITQEQLAELADLSVSYIKQIESGREFKNITIMTLTKIAGALNTDLESLFKVPIYE